MKVKRVMKGRGSWIESTGTEKGNYVCVMPYKSMIASACVSSHVRIDDNSPSKCDSI